jgi:hypothetical protein
VTYLLFSRPETRKGLWLVIVEVKRKGKIRSIDMLNYSIYYLKETEIYIIELEAKFSK